MVLGTLTSFCLKAQQVILTFFELVIDILEKIVSTIWD